MAEGEGVYTDNILVLKNVLGLMLNNEKFSDAVFTVKDQQFYVLSHLLSASSTILNGLITLHYEHCEDKDLKIYNVKYEDSFLLILKYIYGQSLDFYTNPIHILCEVLSLAERYQLLEFHHDLKRFLSTLDCFELESAVVLLNTASNYNLSELYERLIVFAYQHAEQLVEHHTFPDLDYTVLTDLLKSDWFACSEIDILTGVLTWHSGMDRERHNWKTTTSQDDIDMEHDDSSETNPTQSDDEEQDGAEHIDHVDLNEKDTCTYRDRQNWNTTTSQGYMEMEHDDTNENYEIDPIQSVDEEQDGKHIAHLDLNKKDTCTSDNSEQLTEKRDTCPEVMRLFSENILKKLLAQIRFPRMFASDLVRAIKSELGKNYINFLLDETYFSQSSEPRQRYQAKSGKATIAQHRINNVTKTFQIQAIYLDTVYESEEYLVGLLKWKICSKYTTEYTRGKHIFTMYLKCSSDNNQNDWECTVECQLKWISHDNPNNCMILPDDNSYTILTLTRDASCVEIGKWEWEFGAFTADWWKAFRPNHIHMFCLDIKSMQTKLMQ